MTIKSIIDGILAYHPDIGDRRTCDVAVGADVNQECTGIVVSIAPTVEVIRKTIDLGANFIFVHEPTFYSGYDDTCEWLEGNDVYEEKRKLLLDNGIVVYRDHDHMHAHEPDSIFHYVIKQLGWSEYAEYRKGLIYEVKLPETTLGELVQHVKEAMYMDTIRYIGNLDAKVSTVGLCSHITPGPHTNWSNNDKLLACCHCDVVMPLETVDWTVPLFYRDAAMFGRNKGMIFTGHFVQEEAGMRWAHEWLRPIVGDELPMTFISAGDMFKYM